MGINNGQRYVTEEKIVRYRPDVLNQELIPNLNPVGMYGQMNPSQWYPRFEPPPTGPAAAAPPPNNNSPR